MLLSVDAGFAATGYTVWHQGGIVSAGVISTEKSTKKQTRTADDYSFRSALLARGLTEVVNHHGVKAIIGELPSGGALSARAMVMMNMATAVVSAVAELLKLPAEWCTPTEVKKALTGLRGASKMDVIGAACERFDIGSEKNGRGNIYLICGGRWPASLFEHIADSIGAYVALSCGNLVKIYG
jgi:Holliday junction resolvasome RuvABC endonuclease subunit